MPPRRTSSLRSRTRSAAARRSASARPPLVLVLGGIASGKSAYAEKRALHLSPRARPFYVATADSARSSTDPEMAARIRRHRARRGRRWRLAEAPLDLPEVLAKASREGSVALVDCLTLWLGNLLMARRNVASEQARLIAALKRIRTPVVLVSGEAGLGGIAENALARAFADAQGRLNQAIARIATEVVLVAAGLPLVLKDKPRKGSA